MTTSLITGGAGFIGSRLAKALTARGERVVVFDNLNSQVHGPDAPEPDMGEGVIFCRGDIRDKEALRAAVEGHPPDVVYHLAAETGTGQSYDEPARYCEVNVQGTCNLVEILRKAAPSCRRVVLAGSRAVYGEGAAHDHMGTMVAAPMRRGEDLAAGRFAPLDAEGRVLTPIPTPEALPPRPASVYASTKLMQELLLTQCSQATPLKVALLRFQNVYGPGQSLSNPYTGVLSIFSRQILDRKPLDIFEDGAITRDFIYVDDVVQAIVAAGASEAVPDGPVNVGSGTGTTILEAAAILLRALDTSKDNYFISGRFRSGDVRYAVADITRAKSALAWEPKASLNTGLKELAHWVRDERHKGHV